MAYKDKDKEREANRERQRRYRRDRAKGVTEGVTQVTKSDIIAPIPNGLPANFGEPDCECRHCQVNRANGSKLEINHDSNKTINKLAKNEVNRVALPGDVDYEGVAG